MKIRLLAAIAFMFAVIECSAEPVLLKVKWNPGDEQIVDINIVQEQSTTMPGLPVPMQQSTKQTLRTKNTVHPKTSEGDTIVEMEFISTKMDSDMNGVKLTFDSSKDQSADVGNPMAPIMRGMVGSKFKYHMAPDGSLKKVTGMKELIENISQGNPMMKSMMDQMFNEDAMKEMSGGGFDSDFLPKKPVDVGTKWADEQKMSMGPLGETTVSMDYLFKGWEKKGEVNCALITFTGEIKTSGGPSSEAMMGMSIDSLDGTTSGKIWFDPEDGVIRLSKIEQKMKMLMSMPQDTSGGGSGVQIKTDINQSIKNTLVEHKKK